MKNTTTTLLISLLASLALSGCASQNGTTFGRALVGEVQPVPVADVLAEPDKFAGQNTRVAGIVTEVCEAKGCWMRIAPEIGSRDTVFVKFTCPIEGRLIPLDAVGKPATIEGEIAVTELSVDEARHYAEDSGANAEEIAAITKPQIQVRAMSPGALVMMDAPGDTEETE